MRNPKLKPWLDEGIKRFAFNGLKGLSVKEMAEEIKTATSSFYHYFNTKEEYLEQLLEYWHEEGSMKIIQEVFLEDEPEEALRQLFETLLDRNFVHECFLLQMRAASYENELFLKQIEETDKIRMLFLTSLLTRTGLKDDLARKKAEQIYKHIMGLYACRNLIPMDKEEKKYFFEDLESIFGISLKKG